MKECDVLFCLCTNVERSTNYLPIIFYRLYIVLQESVPIEGLPQYSVAKGSEDCYTSLALPPSAFDALELTRGAKMAWGGGVPVLSDPFT
jgi:hypothetical protein